MPPKNKTADDYDFIELQDKNNDKYIYFLIGVFLGLILGFLFR